MTHTTNEVTKPVPRFQAADGRRAADTRICAICGGGPGNEGLCLCGAHEYGTRPEVATLVVTEGDLILCQNCYEGSYSEQDISTHRHSTVPEGTCDACGAVLPSELEAAPVPDTGTTSEASKVTAGRVPSKRAHILLTPATCPCDKREDRNCQICDCGLSVCSACGQAESTLEEFCPGAKPKPPQEQLCEHGTPFRYDCHDGIADRMPAPAEAPAATPPAAGPSIDALAARREQLRSGLHHARQSMRDGADDARCIAAERALHTFDASEDGVRLRTMARTALLESSWAERTFAKEIHGLLNRGSVETAMLKLKEYLK